MKKKQYQIAGLIIAVLIILCGCSSSGYSSITNNPHNFRESIKASLKHRQTTLILIDPNCKDCKRDMETIIKNVRILREHHRRVLVYDVTKLSHKDFNYLIYHVPGADYRNGVATPTFLNLRSSEDHHFLELNQVLRDKGTATQINSFFERIGEDND